jgi:hypothetical protein
MKFGMDYTTLSRLAHYNSSMEQQHVEHAGRYCVSHGYLFGLQ